MLGALLYLRFTSLKNQLLSRFRLLRKPKYFIGAIVGGAYFYFVIFNSFGYAKRNSSAKAIITPDQLMTPSYSG